MQAGFVAKVAEESTGTIVDVIDFSVAKSSQRHGLEDLAGDVVAARFIIEEEK